MALQTFGKFDEEKSALAKKKAKLAAEMTHKKPESLTRVEGIKQQYFTQPPGSTLGEPTERQKRIQRQQGAGVDRGAAPGAQTPDASGTGIGTFQGRTYDTAELNRQGTLSPEASTSLKDRLAAYEKATQTYVDINRIKEGRLGEPTSPSRGGTGQPMSQFRRDIIEREARIRRNQQEEDLRAAERRGEISSRSATARRKIIAEEFAQGRELQAKRDISTAEIGMEGRKLGFQQQKAAAELGLKRQDLSLDQQRAGVDAYFEDIAAQQKKFGLGLEKSRVITEQSKVAKDLLTKYHAGEISKDAAAFTMYRIDPDLAQRLFGDVFENIGK